MNLLSNLLKSKSTKAPTTKPTGRTKTNLYAKTAKKPMVSLLVPENDSLEYNPSPNDPFANITIVLSSPMV